jgi:soluble lytic murein transglycosylase-like protein
MRRAANRDADVTRIFWLLCAAGLAATGMPVSAIGADPPAVMTDPAADSTAIHVADAAHRFSIPEVWIYAVMRAESAGNPRAVSPKGAAGLMQIMPDTWAYLRARYGLGEDIYLSRDNIMAGAAYLRELYDRYGAPGFLAAYNAGPGRYENHLATGRPLPLETIAYVNRLAPIVGGASTDHVALAAPDALAWTRAALFAGRADRLVDHDRDAVKATSEPPPAAGRSLDIVRATAVSAGLFVPLSGKVAR